MTSYTLMEIIDMTTSRETGRIQKIGLRLHSYLMTIHGDVNANINTSKGDKDLDGKPLPVLAHHNSLSSQINIIHKESRDPGDFHLKDSASKQTTVRFGQDLSAEIYAALSDEQKEQLNKLQREASNLSKER